VQQFVDGEAGFLVWSVRRLRKDGRRTDMNRKKILIAVGALVVVAAGIIALVLSGGRQDSEPLGDSQADWELGEPEVADTLSDWDGTWNALISYRDAEDLPDFASKLNKKEGSDWEEKLRTDLVSFRFQDSAMTVYSLPQGISRRAGDVLYDLSYTFVGTAEDSGGRTWHQYVTENSTDYKYLLLSEVENGTIRSFRFRYGSEGLEQLLAMEGWLPMMVDRETTGEQLLEAFR